MYLIISTSTSRNSRSIRLAHTARDFTKPLVDEVKMIDLAEFELPMDNGSRSNDVQVREIANLVGQSEGIVLVVPIYRGDVSIATRNLIQLVGTAWQRKVIGLISVAGESYWHAAVVHLASSMMLEHRNFIVPDFVFAETKSLSRPVETGVLEKKIKKLVTTWIRITESLKRA